MIPSSSLPKSPVIFNEGFDQKKFDFNEPLPRLVQFAYWFSQWKWYYSSYLKHKLTGWKYTQDKSLDVYQSDWITAGEADFIESDRPRIMIHKGRLGISYQSNSRILLTQHLVQEISELNNVQRIMDFGCGAGINFVNMALKFSSVEMVGFDYSPRRVEQTQKLCQRYGIEKCRVFRGDGKNLSELADKSIDVTFANQVLEQLKYDASEALAEISRVTSKKIILFEPVYEWGNMAQKAYLLRMDYLRELPKKLKKLSGWTIQKSELLSTYSNPLEPIGFITLMPAS